MAFGFPVALELTGRRCLVVEVGTMAASRCQALLAAGADVVAIDPDPIPALVNLASVGSVKLLERPYQTGDLLGAFLVLAGGTVRRAEAVAAEARLRGVLCNVMDDPARCDFALPALHRDGDLVVAVTTGGRAPALAGWIRDRLAAALPDGAGALLDVAAEVRREKPGPADLAGRGQLWRDALDLVGDEVARLAVTGRRRAALHQLRSALSDRSETRRSLVKIGR